MGQWSTAVFPTAGPTSVPRPIVIAGYGAAAVLVTVLALARQSGVPATSSIWAEDGNLFYPQALENSFWHTIWAPYNGYEQLVPRLLAQVASKFSAARASEVMAVGGAVGLALICCAVFHMARGLVPPPFLRFLLAASTVLLPVATGELLDNAVNLPWWVLFGAFWAVFWRPQSRPGAVLAFGLGFLAIASDPLAAALLPLCALKTACCRRAREQAASIGLVVGAAYQAVARIGVKERPFLPGSLHGLGRDFAVRIGLGLVAGNRATWWLASRHIWLAALAGAVIFCLVVGVGLSLRETRAFTVVATALCIVLFAFPVWLRNASIAMLNSSLATGSRYAAVPLLVLASVLFVVASGLIKARRPGRPGTPGPGGALARRGANNPVVVGGLLLVVFLPTWAADFRDTNARTFGPSWPAQVKAAAARCHDPGASLERINVDPPGWFTALPCPFLAGPPVANTR